MIDRNFIPKIRRRICGTPVTKLCDNAIPLYRRSRKRVYAGLKKSSRLPFFLSHSFLLHNRVAIRCIRIRSTRTRFLLLDSSRMFDLRLARRIEIDSLSRVTSAFYPQASQFRDIITRFERGPSRLVDPRSLWIVKYSSRGIARSTRIYLTKLRLFISMDEPLFSRTIRFSLPSLSVSISLDERKRERKNSLHVSYFVALSQLSN